MSRSSGASSRRYSYPAGRAARVRPARARPARTPRPAGSTLHQDRLAVASGATSPADCESRCRRRLPAAIPTGSDTGGSIPAGTAVRRPPAECPGRWPTSDDRPRECPGRRQRSTGIRSGRTRRRNMRRAGSCLFAEVRRYQVRSGFMYGCRFARHAHVREESIVFCGRLQLFLLDGSQQPHGVMPGRSQRLRSRRRKNSMVSWLQHQRRL